MQSPTHVFFDFFGTLVQYSQSPRGDDHRASYGLLTGNGCDLTYEGYLSAWNAAYDAFEGVANEALDEFSMDQLCAHFLATALPEGRGKRLVGAFRDAYLEEWSRGVTLIPELGAMLDDLATRCELSVVSNTHYAPLVTGLLRKSGIAEAFATVVTSIEFGRRKPCRTIYEHALEVAGSTAASTLFVGDSFVPDYVGPRAIGMPALLIDPEGSTPVPVEHRLASVLEVRERVVQAL